MFTSEEDMRTLTSELTRKVLVGVALGLILTFSSKWFLFRSTTLVLRRTPTSDPKCTDKRRTENTKFNIPDGKRELVLIGVMTANNFLETRARSVYNTWGKEVPGKLLFFTPENANLSSTLPIVALPTVDDTYPPQKKSFLTLKYMYENYGDKFQWFIRADDDVYIRPERLEKFLRYLNSSNRHFIGQAGTGNKDEFGLLGLEYDENFCMGGPGMIMSQATLAAVAPNVKSCLQNLHSHHEDTEIGRCVRRFAGVSCTWAYEMQNIFHHSSAGREAFTGNLKTKEVHRAVSLHPVKQYNYLYRLHNYMKALQISDLQHEQIMQERLLVNAISLVKPPANLTDQREEKRKGFVASSSAMKYKPSSERELVPWDFVSRSWFSLTQSNPRRKIDGAFKEALDDLVREVMDGLNTHSRERGRIIDFKEIFYAAIQVNPLYGVQYIVDFILIYKKYRGRKMTVPVRHHKIFQQNMEQLELREVTRDWKSRKSRELKRRSRKILEFESVEHNLVDDQEVNRSDECEELERQSSESELVGPLRTAESDDKMLGEVSVNEMTHRKSRALLALPNNDLTFKKGFISPQNVAEYIADLEEVYDEVVVNDENEEESLNVVNTSDISYETFREYKYYEIERSQMKLVNIIVPVAGRVMQFLRFMEEYQKVVLNQNEHVKLIIVLYDDPKNDYGKAIALDVLKKYQERYENFMLKVYETSESFSRGKALEYGASLCADDALLFLNDIDVLFDADSLFRIRQHTLLNRQIYYPVVFSQFDPRSVNGNSSHIQVEISERAGYWRAFGYGIVSIYKSDLIAIGGFDKSIVGWGKEDVDLFEKAVNSTLTIFRSADPGLVHIFHEIECDEGLPEAQMVMCLGSKVNTVFSQKFLATVVLENKTIEDFPEFRDLF